ncbi:Sodium channel protein 60E, partial [Durusdinium trenchii]
MDESFASTPFSLVGEWVEASEPCNKPREVEVTNQSRESAEIIEVDPDSPKREEEDNASSEAPDTSTSSDESAAVLSGARRPLRVPTVPDSLKLVQHTKLRTLHCMEKEHQLILLCGRKAVPERYGVVEEVTAGDVTEPGKTLPFIEKQRRLRAQQTRITGISHKHEQQASHALIDAAFNILETGAVVYLPPSKCGSRDAEIQSEAKNKQKQLLTLEQGTIKATASDALVSVDIGTEMKLMYALQRRGLAFDLVNLVSWPVHMEWVNKLFRALMSEAIPGFNSITLQQLLRADQELFLTIAAEFDGSLKGANVGDPPPLDAVIQRLMNDPRINIHLTPTARGEKRSIQQEGDKVSNPPPKKQKQPKPGAQRSPSQCTAIDKDPGRSENFPVYVCDITNEEQFLNLRTYLEKERSAILHAHFAPSCGTASRARERPLPGFKTAPKPLRSDAHPDGLPNLTESEHQRVSEANRSYAAMSELIFALVELGVSISIENPGNSLLWKTSFLKHLLGKLPTYHVCTFHHCMHGGKRDKDTAWYSFNPRDPQRDLFASLALKCNKQHQHAPWKPYVDASGKRIFPTADEAAYPHLLCERVAYILRTEATKAGFIFPTDLHQQLDHTNVSAKRQLFTTQPRGRRLRPLVSEFSGYVTVVTLPDRSEFLEQALRTLPKGARICHRVLQQRGWNRDDMAQKSRTVVVDERCGTDGQCEVVNIGIPREPSEFIQEALNKGHPRDIIANIRDAERDLLLNLVHQPCSVRFQKRAAFMKKWLKRSLELKESEQKLHDSLAPHLVPILMGKRLLLWKEILIDLAYSDVAVIDDVVKG